MTLEENEVCPGCNQPIIECTDPRNEFGVYEAVTWRCHACTTKDADGDKYKDAAPGLYQSVRRR